MNDCCAEGWGRDACPQEECALRHSFFFFLIALGVLYNLC